MMMSEELDSNPLYRAFLTKFRREFDIACRMGYVIAIPKADSLAGIQIDQSLANSHILMPSRLLKMHFTPLQVGIAHDIELDGRQLRLYSQSTGTSAIGRGREPSSVRILGEERGYSDLNKEYRTLLIERPLVASQPKQHQLMQQRARNDLDYGGSTRNWPPGRQVEASFRPALCLREQESCSLYLEHISQDVTLQLEENVKLMQSNYIILAKFLDDAAARIKALAEAYIPRYENCVGRLASQCDQTRQSIRLAVENYIVYLLHGKISTSLDSMHERDDEQFAQNCDRIASFASSVTHLGAKNIFSGFTPSDELLTELRSLAQLQCPLAIVCSLAQIFTLISEALNQEVKFKQLMGSIDLKHQQHMNQQNGLLDAAPICSDDLIATLVFSLARAKPPRLFSVAKYLDTFGWSSAAKDQAAYQAATFQVSVHYMRNFQASESCDASPSPPATSDSEVQAQ